MRIARWESHGLNLCYAKTLIVGSAYRMSGIAAASLWGRREVGITTSKILIFCSRNLYFNKDMYREIVTNIKRVKIDFKNKDL